MAVRISFTPPNGYGDTLTVTRKGDVYRELDSNLPRMMASVDPGGPPLMIEIYEVPDGF